MKGAQWIKGESPPPEKKRDPGIEVETGTMQEERLGSLSAPNSGQLSPYGVPDNKTSHLQIF